MEEAEGANSDGKRVIGLAGVEERGGLGEESGRVYGGFEGGFRSRGMCAVEN